MPQVVVAIPTFRRPQGLERLLRALCALDSRNQISVLVADNDAVEHQGANLCHRLIGEGYRWKLDVIVVAERGIAQARNALVKHALAVPGMQFIIMLDDDEWPEPQWLEALLQVQRESGADVVRGTVLREFEVDPPAWASGWEGIAMIRRATGCCSMIEGIGNVLITRKCIEALAEPYFDPQFRLTGGEDKEFFVRLRAIGTRFAHADEARVCEHVPASRARLDWLLMRAYRAGNTDMRIVLKHRRSLSDLAVEFVKILGALVAVPIFSIVFCLKPDRRLDGAYKLFRVAGKIGALFGHTYHEYAIIHGR